MAREIILALLLSGCVASQDHVERGDRILSDLAGFVAERFPEHPSASGIANRASRHAEEGAGLDYSALVGLLAQLGLGPGTAGLAGLAGLVGLVATRKNRLAKGTASEKPTS
jgi:hypothetical protein